ncbi:hypothetical protein QVD17_18430 [Tagetes erecta]|uniref:H15 domain-containing protein n=1 Tax=Tagetes erecta TaxID=13708 RepID=A0AAD8NNZ6_TARER|nr:hypothetical protein QVD17_18430 [Tagetes erecta]
MDAEHSGNATAPASTPILPHYPELINAAIEAIDSKNGANKSTISKQIEASYGNLPAAHKTLLSHHLNKMKASGELVVIKNNYVKPDPTSPPRRGRGRPAKVKEPVPEGAVVSPAVSGRKRGRPKKETAADGSPPAKVKTDGDVAPVSGEKKGRGRPRKETAADGSPSAKVKIKGDVAPVSGEKKGRGRPRKVKEVDDPAPANETVDGPAPANETVDGPAPAEVKTDGDVAPVTGEKKGRGRPKKVKTVDDSAPSPAAGEKRGRGRPRKVIMEEAPVEG